MMGNQKVLKFIDIFSYVFLLVNAVAVPLFMDRNLVNFYIIPKQYAFICLLLVNVILFVAKMILSKTLSYRRSIMDLPILGLLLFALFSSIFSVNHYDSFLGRNEYFVFNYVYLIFLAVFYFLITNFINSRARWSGLVDAMVYTGGFTTLVFILKAVFKLDLLSWLFPGALNSIDKINTPFGIWIIVIMLLAAGNLLKKNMLVGKSIMYFFVTILCFASLVLLSFNILWWIVLAGLILLLLVGVSFMKEVRLGWVSALFAMLMLTVIFIAFGTPRYLQTAVPAEISLGAKPSWSITSQTIFSGAKGFLLGSGLGTFNVDFSKYRSVDFNNDTLAWSLRFSQPLSTFMALLAEGGVLITLIILFAVLYVIGHVFNVWFKRGGFSAVKMVDMGDSVETKLDTFITAAAWLVLTGAMAVVFFGPVLWWLWWLMLGLIITGLSFINPEVIKQKEWEVEDTPQYSLTFSFVMIVVLAGLIMVGVWGARLYLAEASYAKAITSKDYNEAQSNLTRALFQRGSSDVYHAALAQVYLMQAVNLVNTGSKDLQAVSSFVAQAVNEARTATEISPRSVAIWENLAIMYENAAVIVPEAREWAIKSWQKAKELEPTNPVLSWRLANNYALSSQMDDAIKNYKEASELKRDYLDSYVGLARVYEQQNKLDEAVESYKAAMSYGAANNPVLLFDFGRLLYNRNKDKDRADAETLWLNSVNLQPNYSNALYSLGLLYESRGDKTTALQYYYKVKDLNPDNKDITSKIRSLVGGGTAAPEETPANQ
ncbi:MAG: tetratricopeptide repeat protein [Candidatus Magasanikbacteria bacterium]|nr:tetratricopeptide repeat protein [Candidatus Magasanikbacteria bacterium]